MRIRTIKPSFWRSDDITALPMDLRLLFIGLWSYVDDNGVGIDDYRQIAADLFALEEDQTAIRRFVRDGVATLSRGPLVTCYMIENKSYLFITAWDEHQKVDRPNKARHPRPPETPGPTTSKNGREADQVAKSSRQSREGPPSVVRKLEEVKTLKPSEANASAADATQDQQPALMLCPPPAPEHDSPAAKIITARDVAATWVDACRQNGVEPSRAQIGQVAKTAKEILASNDPQLVLEAATAAGVKGYPSIDRELTVLAGRAHGHNNGHVPFKSPAPNEYIAGELI